jgi:UDP-2,3-diacylglucosamine pyrophosphatase LpxH
MRRTIAVSDTHIWNDTHQAQITAMCEYIEAQKPPLLVLVGDIGDPWQSSWQDILKTKSWDRLSKLCDARKKVGLETVYVRGNHDQNATTEHLNGVKVAWNHKQGTCLFTHGSEWDPIWGGSVGQFLYWLATRMPRVAKLVGKIYSIIPKGSTPGRLKREGYKDDWTEAAEKLHVKAQEYARRKHLFVVLGHTHCPWANELIADAGDWEDSFSAVEIADDGTATLKHLVNGVMTDL